MNQMFNRDDFHKTVFEHQYSLKPIKKCDIYTKFRSLDGSCNNVDHSTWGQANTVFSRILEPVYEGGKFQAANNNCFSKSQKVYENV